MVRLGRLPKYMHQATAVHLAKDVAHQTTILQVNQGTHIKRFKTTRPESFTASACSTLDI